MKPVKAPKKTLLVLRRETLRALTAATLTRLRGGGNTPTEVPIEIDGFAPGPGMC